MRKMGMAAPQIEQLASHADKRFVTAEAWQARDLVLQVPRMPLRRPESKGRPLAPGPRLRSTGITARESATVTPKLNHHINLKAFYRIFRSLSLLQQSPSNHRFD